MSLTGFGLIVLPVGLILFLRYPRQLLWATVLCGPLFDTAIARIPALTTEIRPAQYLGLLFMLRYGVLSLRQRGIGDRQGLGGHDYVRTFAILYIAVVLASSVMPLALPSNILVIPTESSVATLRAITLSTLQFTRANITQLAYPVFYVLLFLTIRDYVRRRQIAVLVLDAISWSSLIVIVTGTMYLVLFMSGHVNGLDAVYHFFSGKSFWRRPAPGLFGIPRMHSLTGEPGYTGTYLLLSIAVLIFSLGRTRKGVQLHGSRPMRGILLLVNLVATLMTGATTAYAGLALLGFFGTLVSLPARWRRPPALRGGFLAILGLVALELGQPSLLGGLAKYMQRSQIAKLVALSGSGSVRYYVSVHALGVFLRSPLLGVGYGSNRSLAVSTFLLSNVGLLGYVAFLFLMGSIVVDGARSARLNDGIVHGVLVGGVLGLVVVVSLMQFAKSEASLLFSYFWIVGACVGAGTRKLPPRHSASSTEAKH